MQLKKLSTLASKERENIRNRVTIGCILIGIMVLSTLGYALNRVKFEYSKYKEFKFAHLQDGWKLVKHPFTITTKFLPQEVENISLEGSWDVEEFTNLPLYIVAYRDEAKIASMEIIKNLPFKRVQYVCFDDDVDLEGCETLPLKSCSSERIIFINYISSRNETNIIPRIYGKERCIVIEASYRDLIRAVDRFIFEVYDII